MQIKICIDNNRSRSRSWVVVMAVLATSFSLAWTALIWFGTSLFFDWNYLISSSFIFNYSWWYKIQEPREPCKVNLELQFTVYLTKFFNAVCTIFKQASCTCVPSSLFCSSRKVTSKNLPLVSRFGENNFCWQSAEIRLSYHSALFMLNDWLQ